MILVYVLSFSPTSPAFFWTFPTGHPKASQSLHPEWKSLSPTPLSHPFPCFSISVESHNLLPVIYTFILRVIPGPSTPQCSISYSVVFILPSHLFHHFPSLHYGLWAITPFQALISFHLNYKSNYISISIYLSITISI